MSLSKRFLNELGIDDSHQRFFEKLSGERAHYSRQTFDLEVLLDRLGWVEVAGFAYRSDYDLKRHIQATGQDMSVFRAYPKAVEKTQTKVSVRYDELRRAFGDKARKVSEALAGKDLLSIVTSDVGKISVEGYDIPLNCFEIKEEKIKESGRQFIPHVIEPSFGVERLVYATLEYSLKMREDRAILSIPLKLAPVQASVYPLLNRDGLEERATSVYRSLLNDGLRVDYDDAGSIGRRYARADEAGIPLGITVDYETLKNDTVTLRDRDSWRQVRVQVDKLKATIAELSKAGFPKV